MTRRFVALQNQQWQVMGSRQAETADFYVCSLLSTLDGPLGDNQTGTCHDCFRLIYFAPYAPKKPKKICVACWPARVKGGNA